MREAVVVLVLAACSSSPRAVAPGSAGASKPCLADGLGRLEIPKLLDDSCVDRDDCAKACTAGTADACVTRAYQIQRDPALEDEATQLYGRACRLGHANACTNYGAGLWLAHQPASPADEACARRLFERACDVREQFACGMVGRMMASDAKTPAQKEAARRWFDRTCNDLGAMSCRMYAHHLERGDLGAFEAATVHALMQRACDTGDEDACGHETASETFR